MTATPKKAAEYYADYLTILADTPASADQIAAATAMGHSDTNRDWYAGKTVDELLRDGGISSSLEPREDGYGRPGTGDRVFLAIRAEWLAAHPDAPSAEKTGYIRALRAVMLRAAVIRLHAALTEEA